MTRRIFVTDTISFLIDTGADLCLYPRTHMSGQLKKCEYKLHTAHGVLISKYGTVTLNLDFQLRRSFDWKFVICDMDQPIFGI